MRGMSMFVELLETQMAEWGVAGTGSSGNLSGFRGKKDYALA